MYTAPDFVKVSVKAKDIFSSYSTTCPPIYEGDILEHAECAGGTGSDLQQGMTGEWIYMCYDVLP